MWEWKPWIVHYSKIVFLPPFLWLPNCLMGWSSIGSSSNLALLATITKEANKDLQCCLVVYNWFQSFNHILLSNTESWINCRNYQSPNESGKFSLLDWILLTFYCLNVNCYVCWYIAFSGTIHLIRITANVDFVPECAVLVFQQKKNTLNERYSINLLFCH